ncbi:MAG: response regulator transcription factor [Deltaproteobacteria bacterium]|nr:response regulator transcription factor [Deltaproteobacteria bacterium]
MAQTILIVEDERDLLSTIEYNLQREGFDTRAATTGEMALRLAERDPRPELVLLDIMLPDLSGTEVCRRLRQSDALRRVPVIMVTARGEEIDRVVGFEVGADDYVVKPFSVRELVLRVKAILRRVKGGDGDGAGETTFGKLRLDPAAHRVFVEDVEVVLTALEFRLLSTFLTRRGRVQSREVLLADVWGIEADVTTRTVDTHVKRLREKLGVCGGYVETLRGVGYRFRANPDDASQADADGDTP